MKKVLEPTGTKVESEPSRSPSKAADLNQPSPPVSASWRGWFIWSLSALAFAYAFFHRVTPGVMVSELMRDFAIGGGMLGMLSALYFYPYVLLQVPLGALLDRLGARMLLFVALFLAGLGSFIFGMAETLPVAYAGRILIGVGSGVGFLGSLSLARSWFPAERYALLTGLAMFLAMMGGFLGQAPLAIFIESHGWRASQWGLGIFGLVLAVLVVVFVRNAPPHQATRSVAPLQSWGGVWDSLVQAACLWNTWKIALVAASLSGPMLVLGGLWGVPYIMQAYGLSRPQAAFLVSLLLVGWAFGAPLTGWISDHLQRRKLLLVAGTGLLSLSLGLFCLLPNLPLAASIALLIFSGVVGSSMVSCFALVRETSALEIGGAVTGIVNSMTVASGAILQPLVGAVLDGVWDGTIVNGSRVYQPQDYRLAFLVLVGVAAIGLWLSLSLRERR